MKHVIFTSTECDTLDEAFAHLDDLRGKLAMRDATAEAARVQQAIDLLLDTVRGRDATLVENRK